MHHIRHREDDKTGRLALSHVGIKIGQFIYPWGGGHYSRMMRFDRALKDKLASAGISDSDVSTHYSSKGRIYQRLEERFAGVAGHHTHEILMPTPIDGSMGPSLSKSLANIIMPVEDNPALISQIVDYLRHERKIYDEQGFDLVVNDGDVGSNILARNREIPCIFVTNQFRPRLYRSRSYLYPALVFISRQIAKATKILVADSPPPHTICEYNLNFPDHIRKKVEYVGHFTDDSTKTPQVDAPDSHLVMLLGQDGSNHTMGTKNFGYWMRTGNKSTNDGTGKRYEQVFGRDEMRTERRIISHARDDPAIDAVIDSRGNRYTLEQAVEKKVDWVQIDVGFLSEGDKNAVLDACDYAVINGSHTVMGEIMGGKAKPIIGVPIYDEHTNNIRWAHERGLGVLASNTKQIISAIQNIRKDASGYAGRLAEFAKNFDGRGAQNAADIAHRMLQER